MRNPDRGIVRGTVLAASMLVVFGGGVMGPVLPAIAQQFKDFPNIEIAARLVLTLPALLIAINSPIAGYLVDNVGRKRVLTVSMILAGIAGLSGYIAPTLPTILIGRAFLGIAVAGLMTSTSTLIADYWYGPERSRMMGLQAGAMGIAGTLLLLIIGLLADVDWRAPFLVHLLAFVVIPFVLAAIYEPQLKERCLEKPPASGEPGACVGQSIQEAKSELPVHEPEPTPVGLIAFIFGVVVLVEIVFFIVPIQLPFHLQELIGASAAQSGFAISVLSLSFAISSMLFGRLAARFDHISVLMIGFVLIGVGYSLITLSAGSIVLYFGLVVAGIGIGQLIPNLYTWLANETPVHIRGRVMGGFTTAVFLGQFLSPLISQPIAGAVALANTFLVAGVALMAVVPFLFAARGRLRLLGAHPA
jgi:MFS family permease